MTPLGLSDLMTPLSQIVRREFRNIDLLVGVSNDSGSQKFSAITAPLSQRVEHVAKDVCCVFPHQLSHDRWKVITTHGSARMTTVGENFEFGIHTDHLTPQETIISQRLSISRNELLAGLLGSSAPDDGIPYAKVHGNVLLCGDFLLWEPGILLALRHLFIANGAREIAFATPVIARAKCRKLQLNGCKVLRLHPPESQA